ncbi:MAG: ArnT family glycosyltransferase [Terriglobia bacterium]
MTQTRLQTQPSPRRLPPGVPIKVWVVVVVLLSLFAAQNIIEMRRESCTSDEVAHLPAGYSYLLKRDFRLNPEHPPLLKVLCALPLLALRPHMNFDDPLWNIPPHQSEFGSHFLYSNDADRLLFYGRLPMVLISTLLGLIIFRWAQQLYGNVPGLFALTLFAFSPNLIAHSHLVTTDVGVTTFLTAAFYFLWRYLLLGERRSVYWSSLAMGAAMASKFSAIVLLPVAVVLLWMFWGPGSLGEETAKLQTPGGDMQDVRGRKSRNSSRRKENAGLALPRQEIWKSLLMLDRAKILGIVIFVCIVGLIAQFAYLGSFDPTLYLRGLEQVNKNHRPYFQYYLHGNLKTGGWWYYFLVAFLVKATAPFIIMVFLGLIRLIKSWRSEWKSAVFLILPAAVYIAAVCALADPLGVRYLLPVFPFLMILSCRVVPFPTGKRIAACAAGCLLVWHVSSSLMAFPNHLSYFNEFVRGPAHGIEWLDDSNVDWGQDLKVLKEVLDRQGIPFVTLHSFSRFDNPEHYGIHCFRPTADEWGVIVKYPPPGFYAVSAHWLARQKALGLDWMKKYQVVANVGNSMFVFRVS